LTNSKPSELHGAVLLGDKRPRIISVPLSTSTATAYEAIDLAAQAGLHLDEWQQLALIDAMGEQPDGLWTALEVAIILSRQNGKGGLIEARQLAGLFLLDEELQIYTAHQFGTARNAMRRIVKLIQNTPHLNKRLARNGIRYSHTEEGIELKNGNRLLFMARGEAGRGFSCDCLYLDEAMILSAEPVAALLPTLSARTNPQIWYLGSAGIGEKSEQLGRLHKRGHAGGDPGLCYLEWSADLCTDECGRGCRKHDRRDDPRTWARANPALGIRITPQFVEREMNAMKAQKFNQERLGVGDYPADDELWALFPEEIWRSFMDASSAPVGRLALSADISPERTSGAIAIAGRRLDDLLHGEIVDHHSTGVGWMVDRIVELVVEHEICVIVIDAAGPAGTLIAPLTAKLADRQLNVPIKCPTLRDVGIAYSALVTSLTDTKDLRYLDQAALNTAVAGATTRLVGVVKALARKNATTDIAPLVAFVNALWGFDNFGHLVPEETVIEGDLMA